MTFDDLACATLLDGAPPLGTKNLKGKTRPVSDPYETWKNDSGWTWKVLKHYQSPAAEAKNEFARVFCDVSSPYTHGGSDLGDTYLMDIKRHAQLVTP
jgi:hypothetical protein